ncbi:FLICE-associated huge protein [Calliopsis andreniformis]|uniref:FLICE-associated huge protein n=1 Tax=Calliopsis andreniformis TaxID=337506 RepID=UPI003FCC5825
MDDSIDIYEDLPSFDIKTNESTNVSNNQENTTYQRVELEKQITELIVKLQDCQKVNETLETNLFSLLKTAKAEIARKDKMIEDLRKKLDDTVFKRGIYAKTNGYVVHKSNSNESTTNNHYKFVDFPLSSTKHEPKMPEKDSHSYNPIKEHHSKSTLTPITVFSERLHKRIIDEENLEKKDKQLNKFNVSGNTNEYVERYVPESDKENGSLHGTNSCDSKDIQGSTVIEYTESERVKNPVIQPKLTTKDFSSNDTGKSDVKVQDKLTFNRKWTGKRANDETNRSVNAKRTKFSEEELLSDTTNKEINDHISVDSIEEKSLIKYDKFESLDNISERLKRSSKSSDVERDRDSNINIKKREQENLVRKHRNERKETRDETDVLCDKKEYAKEHVSKRYSQYVHNSRSIADKKNTIDRGIETLNRDDHRISVDKRYRGKQREDHRSTRINGRRSRGWSQSVYVNNKCREEKYNRGKYYNSNKYADCGERFDKRYDFRTSTDKLETYTPACDKESSNESRITTDRTRRSAINPQKGRVKNGEASGCHDEHESRGLKNADRTIKREKIRLECNEYPHRNSGNEKLIEHSRYSKVSRSKRGIRKSSCSVEDLSQTEETKSKQISRKSQKESENCADESSITQLEDGEIPTSPCNSPSKNSSEHKMLENSQDARSGLSLCKEIDTTNRKPENTEESVKEVTNFLGHVSPCLSRISNANIASSNKKYLDANENVKNVENMENVENVENIEKFIRNYASEEDNIEEVSTSDEQLSVNSNIVHENDCKNRENSSESRVPDSNIDQIFSHDGKKQPSNEQLETTAPRNTSPNVSEHFLDNKDSKTETMSSITFEKNAVEGFVKKIEHASQTFLIELLGTDPASDYTTKNKLIPIKMESGTSVKNNPDKNNFSFQESSSYVSTTTFNSSGGKEGNDKNYDKTSMENNNRSLDKETCDDKVENKQLYDNLHGENKDCEGNDVHTKKNRNDCGSDKGKGAKGNANIIRKSGQEKEMIVKCREGEGRRFNESSMNVDGKIVVFARRKKPVCLANNNANMTVLINNNHEINVNSSSTRKTIVRTSVSKLRACRRS